MTRLARVFLIVLIAAFAAWSSAHVANATTMTLDMVAMDGMDMADCDDCGSEEMGDRASLACDVACVSPVLADLVIGQAFASAPVTSYASWPVHDFAGRTYPPDPHPPRAFILI